MDVFVFVFVESNDNNNNKKKKKKTLFPIWFWWHFNNFQMAEQLINSLQADLKRLQRWRPNEKKNMSKRKP